MTTRSRRFEPPWREQSRTASTCSRPKVGTQLGESDFEHQERGAGFAGTLTPWPPLPHALPPRGRGENDCISRDPKDGEAFGGLCDQDVAWNQTSGATAVAAVLEIAGRRFG